MHTETLFSLLAPCLDIFIYCSSSVSFLMVFFLSMNICFVLWQHQNEYIACIKDLISLKLNVCIVQFLHLNWFKFYTMIHNKTATWPKNNINVSHVSFLLTNIVDSNYRISILFFFAVLNLFTIIYSYCFTFIGLSFECVCVCVSVCVYIAKWYFAKLILEKKNSLKLWFI